MTDPFPEENDNAIFNFSIPNEITDLVYKECRYQQGKMPDSLFLPTKKIMFKVMRACVYANGEKN